MSPPNEIFDNWHGIIDNDFSRTIRKTFNIPEDDKYVYRTESFAMTLPQIQTQLDAGSLKYKYQSHGQQIEVSSTDIEAYTSIFSPATDTHKAFTAFTSNAKKASPRETVAQYLQSRRISISKVPKSKTHINPYYDLWALSCRLTSFLGPLPDPSYAHPTNAKMTHPILPVFYHHFGCVVPSYEALYIISEIAAKGGAGGIIDMASGNGYWTYMLRRMKVGDVTAVDNIASEYRTMWITDTVKSDGVDYLKQHHGGKGKILLMVYTITAGNFTKRVLQAYRGDVVILVGTQNTNRYTGFSDYAIEEYFEKEMPRWEMTCRIAMPSFAGKDDGMYIWVRKK
ncbi:hypothetical protein EG329_008939 [Mollisiaceae sp. DMI_Dod_QoI]|nr:hypothetical protein EG329_008939 [Helotiales sp. DMI_Dod_QoI]